MTITKLAKLNVKNGGCFFVRANLKANGETLRSFRIETDELNKTAVVTRIKDNYQWEFSLKTGRVVHN